MHASESEATAKIPARFRHRFTFDAVSVVVGRLLRMPEPFIGSERIATGALTPYALRSKFVAIYPDIYVSPAADVTAVVRARAAWLWSRRRGIVAGQSAAALHRAKWVDNRRAAELLWPNRHPPKGIHTWSDQWADDEIDVIDAFGRPRPPGPPSTSRAAIHSTGPSRRSMLWREQHSSRSPTWNFLPTATKADAGSGGPVLLLIWSIPARSRRERVGCDCSSSGMSFRDRRHKFLSTTNSVCSSPYSTSAGRT